MTYGYLDSEVGIIQSHSSKNIDMHESSALLAFIIGSLVFGAFAPKKVSGFAAKMGKKILDFL